MLVKEVCHYGAACFVSTLEGAIVGVGCKLRSVEPLDVLPATHVYMRNLEVACEFKGARVMGHNHRCGASE